MKPYLKANEFQFVLSKNLRRRPCNASQTVLLMVRITDIENGGLRLGSDGQNAVEIVEMNKRSTFFDSDSLAFTNTSETESVKALDQQKVESYSPNRQSQMSWFARGCSRAGWGQSGNARPHEAA